MRVMAFSFLQNRRAGKSSRATKPAELNWLARQPPQPQAQTSSLIHQEKDGFAAGLDGHRIATALSTAEHADRLLFRRIESCLPFPLFTHGERSANRDAWRTLFGSRDCLDITQRILRTYVRRC
jgi:hypothetical protein